VILASVVLSQYTKIIEGRRQTTSVGNCLAEDAHVGDDHDDKRYKNSKADDSYCVWVRSAPLNGADSLVGNIFIARPPKHWRQREQRRWQPDPCTQIHAWFYEVRGQSVTVAVKYEPLYFQYWLLSFSFYFSFHFIVVLGSVLLILGLICHILSFVFCIFSGPDLGARAPGFPPTEGLPPNQVNFISR